MQFNPVINTSVRGHGKWGDFLVALIPLSWCGNILINSNFILRMIEWQNESSLFTIRIQGKQWYWVYKFDATAAYNILAAPKNIGHNRWFVTVPGESYCADSYYQALHLGAQLEYKNMYFKLLKDEGLTRTKLNSASLINNSVHFQNTTTLPHEVGNATIDYSVLKNSLYFKPRTVIFSNYTNYFTTNNLTNFNNFYKSEWTSTIDSKVFNGYYDFSPIDDSMNFASNLLDSVKVKPFRFIRGVFK